MLVFDLFCFLIELYEPLDSETSHSRLLCQDVPPDLLDDGLGWRIGNESFIRIFVVDIVTNTDKFAVVISTGQEDDGDTNDFSVGNLGQVGSICFEEELVDADWDWAHEESVKYLIMLGSVRRKSVTCTHDMIARCPYEVADPTYVNFHSKSGM